ncbi:ABC-2 type transport system permease protein [Natranaerovirga pectinivora]|uniref:ABC-2 type transport system permease protein n=1 Tax=Natranaerovirga pectinivora TaxID=682400 RepID=A0A4R3MMB9_9FIRM|nr:ABC transporter permease [Natranaerovirga pectinivora]TCT16089.1 ABC-2 type transport system permease protein [Natranaerovirga pectinivora]
MDFSIKRVNALFKKEIKDFTKNLNVFFMCLLPILFAFIYSFLGSMPGEHMEKSQTLLLVMTMNLVIVGCSIMAILISEEKEKNTLRTLMLSSVSPVEFLTGKTLVMLVITILNNIFIYMILGLDSRHMGMYIILSTLVVITMITIGAIIGLMVQNQMATGVMVMPIALGFLMIPMLGEVNEVAMTIAEWLPNYNLEIILERVFNEDSVNIFSKNLTVIIGWIIGSIAIFVYVYKKKGLDK